MYIGTTSIIIILCIEIAIGVESVFGQQGVDSEDPSELVEITVLANKFCPPGFIVDESGYCDPEKSSLGPSVGSTGGRENITSEKSETWPASNNDFFTFKQLMSRGQLLYLVYENELFDFKIEYPQGVWPCCDEGYSPAYSTNGITEVVSFQIGISYPDVVNLRILIDDRSDSNDSALFG